MKIHKFILILLMASLVFLVSCRTNQQADINFEPTPIVEENTIDYPDEYDNKYYLYENQLSLDERLKFLDSVFECMAVVDVFEVVEGIKTKIGEIVKDASMCFVEIAVAKYELPKRKDRLKYSIKGMNDKYYKRLPEFLIACESMLIKSKARGMYILDEENHCINIFRSIMGRVIN